jgi:hypothetical protein
LTAKLLNKSTNRAGDSLKKDAVIIGVRAAERASRGKLRRISEMRSAGWAVSAIETCYLL